MEKSGEKNLHFERTILTSLSFLFTTSVFPLCPSSLPWLPDGIYIFIPKITIWVNSAFAMEIVGMFYASLE
jgi:hypothetical protein